MLTSIGMMEWIGAELHDMLENVRVAKARELEEKAHKRGNEQATFNLGDLYKEQGDVGPCETALPESIAGCSALLDRVAAA